MAPLWPPRTGQYHHQPRDIQKYQSIQFTASWDQHQSGIITRQDQSKQTFFTTKKNKFSLAIPPNLYVELDWSSTMKQVVMKRRLTVRRSHDSIFLIVFLRRRNWRKVQDPSHQESRLIPVLGCHTILSSYQSVGSSSCNIGNVALT